MRQHPIGERWPITGVFMDVTPPTWSKNHPHLGVDFAAPRGTPVFAPADGLVVTFGNNGSFGARSVCLDIAAADPQYPYHLFAHLSARSVNVGERVRKGQLIGWVGGWGLNAAGQSDPNAYGDHLHWQRCKTNQFPRDVNLNGDPLAWLNEEDDMTKDEVEALVLQKRQEWLNEEIDILGSTQLQATEALVKRQRAMGRATTLADVIKANDPNEVPASAAPDTTVSEVTRTVRVEETPLKEQD